jgi:hypothetical protein
MSIVDLTGQWFGKLSVIERAENLYGSPAWRWLAAVDGLDDHHLWDLPLIGRKRRLARLLGRAKRRAIRLTEHLTGDGPTVFEHVCRWAGGIVSKRTDAPYRSGPSRCLPTVKARKARS